MAGERFRRLERDPPADDPAPERAGDPPPAAPGATPPAPLPLSVRDALLRLSRFSHLEIGPLASERRPGAFHGKVLCSSCGQHNELGRQGCWACGRKIGIAAAAREAQGPDLTLVLDGRAYDSRAPDLPEDVHILFERIRRSGYRPELLAEWRSWRAFRNRRLPGGPGIAAETAPPFELSRLGGAWVMSLGGRVHRSTDADLPPEVAEVFRYVEEHGPTPELLEQMRAPGAPSAAALPASGAGPTAEREGAVSRVGSLLESAGRILARLLRPGRLR